MGSSDLVLFPNSEQPIISRYLIIHFERKNKSFFQVGRVLVSRAGKVGSTVSWQKRCQICT